MIKHTPYLLPLALLAPAVLWSQDHLSDAQQWQHQSAEINNVIGVDSKRAYAELIDVNALKTVVVAVIDGGTDIEHEDLRDVLWINEDEVPGDGVDNDGNGYVDDVYGWSFLSGPGGEIGPETLEYVRQIRRYQNQENLTREERKDLKKLVKRMNKERKLAERLIGPMGKIKDIYEEVLAHCGHSLSDECIASYTGQKGVGIIRKNIARSMNRMAHNGVPRHEMEEIFTEGYTYFYEQLYYNLNPEFDPRHLVGDDPTTNDDPYYGDARVLGPDASHGTHVAGIIAAKRGNGIGMDGIAVNARIMTLRVVPNGDERDKDVANAIRYAVDNGAKIINMSFGKDMGEQDQWVEEAIRYAAEHDVLMVHAAGNDSRSVDEFKNYPNGWNEETNTRYDHWIEVGASSFKGVDHLAASFSNYGNQVDVFAPGDDIYSTIPSDRYDTYGGTSMATPVVSGVAAVVWGMYPELTAVQLKKVLMISSVPYDNEVVLPGKRKKTVPFATLSETGAVINLYSALLSLQGR
ncbi:MAG: hypothetical protein RL754_676 [Bacteroidota bacterium]|jgi:subtilisin family serine protease